MIPHPAAMMPYYGPIYDPSLRQQQNQTQPHHPQNQAFNNRGHPKGRGGRGNFRGGRGGRGNFNNSNNISKQV